MGWEIKSIFCAGHLNWSYFDPNLTPNILKLLGSNSTRLLWSLKRFYVLCYSRWWTIVNSVTYWRNVLFSSQCEDLFINLTPVQWQCNHLHSITGLRDSGVQYNGFLCSDYELLRYCVALSLAEAPYSVALREVYIGMWTFIFACVLALHRTYLSREPLAGHSRRKDASLIQVTSMCLGCLCVYMSVVYALRHCCIVVVPLEKSLLVSFAPAICFNFPYGTDPFFSM